MLVNPLRAATIVAVSLLGFPSCSKPAAPCNYAAMYPGVSIDVQAFSPSKESPITVTACVVQLHYCETSHVPAEDGGYVRMQGQDGSPDVLATATVGVKVTDAANHQLADATVGVRLLSQRCGGATYSEIRVGADGHVTTVG